MKSIDWLRTHPWIGTAFLSGALLGALLCLPLIPYQLPDSSATLLGSAIGAALAVFGASWLAQGKERRDRATARKHLISEISRAYEGFDVLSTDRACYMNSSAVAVLYPLLSPMRQVSSAVLGRVKTMEPLFHQLGPVGLVAFYDVTSAIKRFTETLSELERVAHVATNIELTRSQLIDFRDKISTLGASVEKVINSARSLGT